MMIAAALAEAEGEVEFGEVRRHFSLLEAVAVLEPGV